MKTPHTDLEDSAAVAIVGMSARFPGADTLDQYWQNLAAGIESIRRFDEATLRQAGVSEALRSAPTYVPAAGAIDQIDCFDAGFFGLSARDAEVMDPQQRVFLEECWKSLEDAGYNPKDIEGLAGVFAGVGWNTYLLSYAMQAPQEEAGDVLQYRIRNDKDFLSTLVSYHLNLRGPSMTVQTACSTSLVTIHLACQSLIDFSCDLALAGGVNLSYPAEQGYTAREGVFSADGHCRAFDAKAQGTVSGSGVGVLVLKRLEDALSDGDTIRAVIRGSAINNDGRRKAGYTAPSVDGQIEVIALAHALAGVDASEVSYVEAHGTGTPLGDPIEVEALTQVFRQSTNRKQFCGLGSVKTNIGHLDAAAGVASVIKTVLALEHKQLPASLHYDRANPRIDFAGSPFFVVDELRPWEAEGGPRIAGVSAFGVGGTNAHVVLQEAAPATSSSPSRPVEMLLMSARSAERLDAATKDLAEALAQPGAPTLADAAYTTHVGRQRMDHRRVALIPTGHEAADILRRLDPEWILEGDNDASKRPVDLLFPGLGNHYVGMGRGLYETEPVFKETVDRCARLLEPHLGCDLRQHLYPAQTAEPDEEPSGGDAFRRMLQRDQPKNGTEAPTSSTKYAQPLQFVVSYALAQLWESWGIVPRAMLGHSIGEYVAATLAGVFKLEDALRIVALRARLIEALEPGAMLAVSAPESEVVERLGPDLSVSAVNAPRLTVVGGGVDTVQAFAKALEAEGIGSRLLQTGHAFHTHRMRPIVAELKQALHATRLAAPQRPYVSGVTGTWVTPDQATSPAFWCSHLEQPVRYADAVATLWKDGRSMLLEVGPGNTLGAWALQNPVASDVETPTVLASLPHEWERKADTTTVASALAKLWLGGAEIDWAGYHEGRERRRVPLPTYPFERTRYALPMAAETATPSRGGTAEEHAQRSLDDWFYVPTWRQTPLLAAHDEKHASDATWLLVAPRNGEQALADAVRDRLEAMGASWAEVASGDGYAVEERSTAGAQVSYTARLTESGDYARMLGDLAERGMSPTRVVHLLNLGGASQPEHGSLRSAPTSDPREIEQTLDASFYSLLALLQAWSDYGGAVPRLAVVSDRVQSVTGAESLMPARAALLGPCRVAPQEIEGFESISLDVDADARDVSSLSAAIVRECAEVQLGHHTVAYRNGRRWVLEFSAQPLPEQNTERWEESVDGDGAYIITGGLGGLGLAFAERLVQAGAKHLILASRSASEDGLRDAHTNTARRIATWRSAGVTVDVRPVDVTDAQALAALVDEHEATLRGVIHAAGVAPTGLIQVKTRDAAAGVLAPKVLGTYALEAALAECDLDFVVLCSSLHALFGGIGTVDHSAANAVLDAWAYASPHRTVAINWGGWAEVGQAAHAVVSPRVRALLEEPASNGQASGMHPLLSEVKLESAEELILTGTLDPSTQWPLDEHRVAGGGMLPGTAMVGLMNAAATTWAESPATMLRAVQFLRPLIVEDGTSTSIEVRVSRREDGTTEVTLYEAGDDHSPVSKAIVVEGAGRPDDLDLDAIKASYEQADYVETDDEGLGLGPRWRGLIQELWHGEGALLARLELAEAFAADVDHYDVHPALLDVATGLLRAAGTGTYLPLEYESVEVFAPLPAVCYSHVRVHDRSASDAVLCGDVLVMDETGSVCARLNGYTVRKIEALGAAEFQPSQPAAFQATEGDGIRPELGAEAFARILGSAVGPQVAVSIEPLERFETRTSALTASHLVERLSAPAHSLHQRPQLATRYEPPRSELEEALAEAWQETLHVEQVGIHDSFFELGGDSLLASQLVTRLGVAYGIELPLRALFEHASIAQLAPEIVARQLKQMGYDGLAEVEGADFATNGVLHD
ncbi:MAG: SDR family NAD(P)-dependent oxidoreductase [Bacteroidota bacterium]